MFKRWRFSIAFILFAVFTGAELSALMFADMAVIGGEIATTLEEDRILSSGNAEEKEMLGIYQNIAAVYGITRVGGSILEFSMTPGNIQKLGTKLKSLGKESTDKVVRGFLYLKDKAGMFKFKNLANVQELKAKFVASSRTLRLNAMAANAPPQFYTYVNNLGHVVVEEIGYGKTMVGFWAEDALTGEIHLSQIRWYDPATAGSEIKAIVTKYTNIRYEAQSGEIVVGDLEVLQLRNGGVWVRVQGAGSDLLNAFKTGYSKESILAIPKGSRPNPSVYLKDEYIANHLNKFESEGTVSRIVSKDDYNNYGVGKPDIGKTEFVGLKSEIDNILTLPISEQVTKLGIPIEQLQNANLVRIDFNLSNNYKVQIPSGNEFGANTQWLPGGKLPTGLNEAVIKTEGMQLNVHYFVNDL